MIRDTSIQDSVVFKPKKTKRKIAIFAFAIFVTAITFQSILNEQLAEKSISRTQVQLAVVERGDLVRDVVAMGKVVAANAPQMYCPEQGFVDLKVTAGDEVNIGQVIAIVESPELKNQLSQERSELARLEGEVARKELDANRQSLLLNKQLDLAKVDFNAADRENRRAQLAISQNLISQIDLEKAVDDLAKAKLTLQHAKKEVSLAKDTLTFELQASKSTLTRQQLVVKELERQVGNLTIIASVNGIVGNLNVQPKALVAKNQSLMTLVDLSAYEVELQVPENFANELGLGMAVELKIGNREVIGRLSAISPEVSEREVTTRVRFDDVDLTNIRQNQQVSARILLENKSNVLKVRRGSFLQTGGHIAYLLQNNLAKKVAISIGAESLREVEVLAGLKEGDQIIISGYEQFKQAPSVLLNN